MPNVVLLIFEGARTESKIFGTLEKSFFADSQTTILRATYDADIYQLWRKLAADEDLDVVEVVRDINAKNKNNLQGVTRKQVSQTYLFFDYDGHATNASDESISEMLAHFNNETEHGKLYISYPMVEAFRHIKRTFDFCHTKFEIAQGTSYKNHVHNSTDFPDIKKIGRLNWLHIILENYRKANFLVRGICRKPCFCRLRADFHQESIFACQRKHFINPKKQVSVLSAFPFFIVEYFGETVYKEL